MFMNQFEPTKSFYQLPSVCFSKILIDNFYSSEDREIKYLVSIAVYVAYLLVHSFAILSCSSLKMEAFI